MLTIWNTYWDSTTIANLPANVRRISAGIDQPIFTQTTGAISATAAVGDLVNTEDSWMNATEKLYKYTLDLHTYVRSPAATLASHTDFGSVKKQRAAVNNMIRTIMEQHPFRPVPDVFQIEAVTRAIDRDMRTEREITLHSVQQGRVWIVEAA